MLIRITGIAAVFKDDDRLVSDRNLLRQFDGLQYDDERFTDYLGGSPDEDALAELLEPGGYLSFHLYADTPVLHAVTEYRASRRLTDAELNLLYEYTMGQWDDGIGENVATETGVKRGMSLQCQTDDPLPQVVQIEM